MIKFVVDMKSIQEPKKLNPKQIFEQPPKTKPKPKPKKKSTKNNK
tara:strand:+ start:146 stop:280 length:135 start_codon:yes stop_codon:yes gene_type:complete